MHDPSTLKQEFLKKWIIGLQLCTSINSKKHMSFLERKNAIKLSADLAMASTRNGTNYWSRAIHSRTMANSTSPLMLLQRKLRSRKGFWRRRARARSNRVRKASIGQRKVVADCVARKLVKKRSKVLRDLVPGGHELIDEEALIEETLDYIASLRVQVDVMRCLANAHDNILKS